ncbi:MAG: flavocytochrome c [Bacillota bacterium]
MEKADLIIIGSGAAGLRAGIHAQENAIRSIIVEKRRTPGGNTRISDGGVAAADTDLQRRAGIEDSPALMKADMLKAGLHKNAEALVDRVTQGAREAFYWTRSIGVEYEPTVLRFGGHSRPRCYTPKSLSGRTLVQKGVERYLETGGTMLKNTKVTGLVCDQGRILGVRVQSDEGIRTLYAEKGVLIASGGFGADTDYLKTIDRTYRSLDTTNVKSATAESLMAAMEVGADTVDLEQIQLAPWTSPREKGFGHSPKFGDYIALPKGILINQKTGERFVNELADRKTVADAVLKTGMPAIAIADNKAVKRVAVDLSKALENGSVTRHDDLTSLADAHGLDAKALRRTIGTWNTRIEKGRDEAFGKPLDESEPMDTPPYYGMEVWPKVHYTMGGLRIDTGARVLDKEGRPIPGLYAAGEATGGVHGSSRLGSCALTDALVMGRIAVRTILDETDGHPH